MSAKPAPPAWISEVSTAIALALVFLATLIVARSLKDAELVTAFASFVLAAGSTRSGRLNLTALGLALWVLSTTTL